MGARKHHLPRSPNPSRRRSSNPGRLWRRFQMPCHHCRRWRGRSAVGPVAVRLAGCRPMEEAGIDGEATHDVPLPSPHLTTSPTYPLPCPQQRGGRQSAHLHATPHTASTAHIPVALAVWVSCPAEHLPARVRDALTQASLTPAWPALPLLCRLPNTERHERRTVHVAAAAAGYANNNGQEPRRPRSWALPTVAATGRSFLGAVHDANTTLLPMDPFAAARLT